MMNSVLVGMRHCSPTPIKPPAIITAKQAATPMASVGIFESSRCVMRSRDAEANAEANPSSVQTSNEPGAGLTMNSVPISPTAIAVQRRQPTTSLKRMTDKAVRIRGDASTIDSNSARPTRTKAVTNSAVAQASRNERKTIHRLNVVVILPI